MSMPRVLLRDEATGMVAEPPLHFVYAADDGTEVPPRTAAGAGGGGGSATGSAAAGDGLTAVSPPTTAGPEPCCFSFLRI